MKLYSYVIPRDYGFAPNPYFGYCTLATCKPKIRGSAQIGDWVAAFGSARSDLSEKLVFLMKVEEILTFDEYWEDVRFKIKRPVFSKSVKYMYGDNIYHHVNGEWQQEFSHHSMPDGKMNYTNLKRDTGVNRVLIATEFFYFGYNAISLPSMYNKIIHHGIGHHVNAVQEDIENFVKFIEKNYAAGISGTPYSWSEKGFVHYKG